MEKRTPHYKLAVVHALVKSGKVRATGTALAGGATLGLDVPVSSVSSWPLPDATSERA
jgi:hypothetical protein